MPLINKLSPYDHTRFIDVFGGSATVTFNQTLRENCLEVYNDYNSNLTNLMFCVKERTMALIKELGFLPFKSRDDYEVLKKFFSCEVFTDDYLEEELNLTKIMLPPLEAHEISTLMKERSRTGDVRRAADYFKLIRYSFSGTAKSFGGSECDIRKFFHLIWKCSERLSSVLIENKDFEKLILQYDRPNTMFYLDPPYFETENYYEDVGFTVQDHIRLRDALLAIKGKFLLSYNDSPYIRELYSKSGIWIESISRISNIAQRYSAGAQYPELLISNYDTYKDGVFERPLTVFDSVEQEEKILRERKILWKDG